MDETSVPTNGAVFVANPARKSKFKRFKGFITGKTRKQRKEQARREAEAQANSSSDSDSPRQVPGGVPVNDDPTVFGADIDNQSVASSSAGSVEDNADAINIVLLLMDPQTRRFELLQLEFDSKIAKVEDIFTQIPISATEPSLKNQTYVSICTPSGTNMDSSKDLSEYVTKAAVVIAVPEFPDGSNGVESAVKMAKPILSNSKVTRMLSSSGFDIPSSPPSSLPESVPEEPSSPEPKETIDIVPEKKEEKPAVSEVKEEKESINFFSTALMLAVLFHFLMKIERNITSPLGPGDSLALGQWKSKCGMAGLLPMSDCSPAAVEMGRDGVFSVYKGEEIVFSLTGSTCSDDDDDDCVDGLIVEDDGTVMIGGVVGKVSTKSLIPLNPWPFVEGVGITSGKWKWGH